MKFPFSWLADFVDMADIEPEQLAKKLISAGFEVEEIISTGVNLSNIITGRIESLEKHPNADRLQITQIFDGVTTRQIVTGARNVSVGDVVPVSLPGAVLASGLKIKPSVLRGVESNGMLCSKTELGIDELSDGIWILHPSTPLGLNFVDYAQLKDSVFDVSILPNRGDCQSMLGLAREISVLLGRPLRQPEMDYLVDPEFKLTSGPTQLIVDTQNQCPVYLARSVGNIFPAPTPLWMERRLSKCGIRSHNIIVDITNYVLLELGQPLHAFDADKWEGDVIRVGSSPANITFQTLDQETRAILPGAPIVSDRNGVVSLAGVMGGFGTSVDSGTRNIILESAYFTPVDVRRSRNHVGLRTESSIRFERGVDPLGVQIGADRALHLLQTLTNASVSSMSLQVETQLYSTLLPAPILMVPQKINQLLGTTYPHEMQINVLKSLGFSVNSLGDTWEIVPPSWRCHDVKDWPCLAEEVARIIGLDGIPNEFSGPMIIQEKATRLSIIRAAVETFLINQGFQEIQTYTMISPDDLLLSQRPVEKKSLMIQNPLSVAESTMRSELLASILKTAAFNIKRQISNLRLFEVGKVFFTHPDGTVCEHIMSGALVTGDQLLSPYTIDQKEWAKYTFSHLNGLMRELLDQLDIVDFQLKSTNNPLFHPTLSADLWFGDIIVGTVGFVHPDGVKGYDIRQSIGYIEFNLTLLASLPTRNKMFSPFGRFPSIRRDLAFLAPKTLGFDAIQGEIKSRLPAEVMDFYLFDLFESDSIGANHKSVGFAFIYQHSERTLLDDEVNEIHAKFVDDLRSHLPVSIR
ncbi:phenylalanine--tRNA ligase subunit beta [bacterium]|nr:phenylalanine--tRNA ligase subunit beta [bacterium]